MNPFRNIKKNFDYEEEHVAGNNKSIFIFYLFYLLFLRANKKVTVQADENIRKTEHNMVTPLKDCQM